MVMTIKELKADKRNIKLDIEKMQREYEKEKTNDILHAIISLLTGGMWLLFWLIISLNNGRKRNKLEGKIDKSRQEIINIEGLIDELKEP